MKTSVVAFAASLIINGVSAFSDTSPHLYFASNLKLGSDSSYLEKAASREQEAADTFIAQTNQFEQSVRDSVEGCPADTYLFIQIPGLHSDDLEKAGSLSSLYEKATVKFAYPYVTASNKDSSANKIASELAKKCNAELVSIDTKDSYFEPYVDAVPRVLTFDFESLPIEQSEREQTLQNNLDFALSRVLYSLPSPNYAVIISSTPTEHSTKNVRASSNVQKKTTGSLFARYTFFGAGIFEITLVSLFLIYALITALSWLTSLNISYKAFEKQPTRSSKAQ